MVAELPSGTVTFLFTDIEGSTKLWERYPGEMKLVLARHDDILRQAIESNGGRIIKHTGDGVHAAFDTGVGGVHAALSAQQALHNAGWEEIGPHGLRVRMGLHTGEAEERSGDYYGPALNRAARLMSVAHGGQTLISSATAELVRDQLPPEASLRDLGEHRLRDLVRSEHVFQLLHPALPADFPPLQSVDVFPNNLSIQLTSFIGREDAIEEAEARLLSARLLTLIGPGGTGKSRLAMQLAADVLPRFSDGVWVVELAPLSDPALLLSAIASVFGVRQQPTMPLIQILIDFLRAKSLLIILDNCEHLVEACARLANELLHACPELKIVASSREALGISGEVIYRVPPLSLPDPATTAPEAIKQSESVQLFVERASAANPRFTLTEHNAPAIAQVCRRLDGIPLAVELAAARATMFSPDQIASRLDDRFRLLTGGDRTALPRQQTLRALIDWSYDLLSDDERTLFRGLSVFAGGWSFEAAEAICPELDVLDLLAQLVNKSLVIVDDENDLPRYGFLETVRQYARDELLKSGEAEVVRNRHLAHFRNLAEMAKHPLSTEGAHPGALEWINRLEMEYDNIRAALNWAIEYDPEAAVVMGNALYAFWFRRGYEEEGRAFLQEALDRLEAVSPLSGETSIDRKTLIATGLLSLISLAFSHGDSRHAAAAAEKCIRLARELGNLSLQARALAYLFTVKLAAGELQGLNESIEEGIRVARQSEDKLAIAMLLGLMGSRMEMAGYDVETARAYSKQGLELMRESGNRWGLAMTLLGTGMAARHRGDFEQARLNLATIRPLFIEMGDMHRSNMVQSELAHIERAEGHLATAEAMYRETIREWQRLGHRAAVAHQLESLAFLAKAREQGERAARLLGAAEALREQVQIAMTVMERALYDREVAELRAGMEAERFGSCWAEGRALTMGQAVEYAVDTATPGRGQPRGGAS